MNETGVRHRGEELGRLVAEFCTGLDPDTIRSADVEPVFDTLVAMNKRVDGAVVRMTARYEQAGAWKRGGAKDADDDVARKTGTSKSRARRRRETSKRLKDLARTDAAVRAGELSADQAAAVASGAAAAPAEEEALLEAARSEPLAEVERKAAEARASADTDPAARYRRQHALRTVKRWLDDDGLYNLLLKTTPELGAEIDARLKTAIDHAITDTRDTGRAETYEAIAADVVTDILTGRATHPPTANANDNPNTHPNTGPNVETGTGPTPSPTVQPGTGQTPDPGTGQTPDPSTGPGAGSGGRSSDTRPPVLGDSPAAAGGNPTLWDEPTDDGEPGRDDTATAQPAAPDTATPVPDADAARIQDPRIPRGSPPDPPSPPGAPGAPDLPDPANAPDLPGSSGAPGPSGAPEPRNAHVPGRAAKRQANQAVRPDRKVIAFIDLTALNRGHAAPGETCHIAGIGPVPAPVIRSMLSDAFLALVIKDGRDVLNVTHLGRQVTAHQRTALEARGYRCEIDGCGATRHLDIDHVTGWALTNDTRLEDLAWLCRHHHRRKTAERLILTGPPGKRRLTHPDHARHEPANARPG